MPSQRNYSNTASVASLANPQSATDVSITVNSYAGFPAAPFTADLARGTSSEEVVLVTAVVGNTLTVTRGYDGTTAKAQSAGATLQHAVSAIDFAEANAHTTATAAVHGVAGALVGTTDTQTLSNKTLTTPTLSSPTVTGTLTGQGFTHTGNGTISGTLGVTGVLTASGGISLPGTAGLTLAGGNASVGGTLAVTGASTLTGAATLNGGATVPTGKSVTLTDQPVVTTDAANKAYVDKGDAKHYMIAYPNGISFTASADTAYSSWVAAPAFDTDSIWDQTNKRIVIPAGLAGKWRFHARINLAGTTSATTTFIFRFIKGTTQTTPPTNAIGQGGQVTFVQYCDAIAEAVMAAGDIVTFQYYTAQSGLTGGGASFGAPSYLYAEYLGS